MITHLHCDVCVFWVMELPNAFQCCAFISCQGGGRGRGGGGGGEGGLVWEREDFAGRDSTEVSSPGEP